MPRMKSWLGWADFGLISSLLNVMEVSDLNPLVTALLVC